MQDPDEKRDDTDPHLSRRTIVAGALTGGVAVSLIAWRAFAAGGGNAPPAPQAPLGSVSAFDFLNAEQLADVRQGRGLLDVTAACQRALRAARQVHFPPGTYLVDAAPQTCLRPSSDQILTFAEGAVLKARSNALEQYNILLLENVRNVLIEGGTIVGDRASHESPTGEHGMGVGIYGSAGVTLRGVTVRDCWGDGIYVGGRGFEGRSSNVRIEHCTCDGNRRQGLTISAVVGCTVVGGRFVRTRGTLPASGIDIEPNYGVLLGVKRPKPGATDIVIDGAECSDNEGHGLTLSQVHTRGVRIVNVVAKDNGMCGISCGYPGGGISIEDVQCDGNGAHGIEIFGDKAYVTKGIEISQPTCTGNRGSGISVRLNVDGFSIVGGTVANNGENGIVCDGTGGSVCDDGVIQRVHVHSNSQRSPARYDNILIGPLCHRITVENNVIDEGTGGRKPRYGINVVSDGPVVIAGNDLRRGGIAGPTHGLEKRSVVVRDNAGLS